MQSSDVAGQIAEGRSAGIQLPDGFADDRNSLRALIANDPVLGELYSDTAFILEMSGELVPLASPLLKDRSTWYTLAPGDRIALHVRRSLFDANCPQFLTNALFLQMLRDTPVVHGDEQRTKQAPLFSYQLFVNALKESTRLGAEYLMADLSGIIELHREHYQVGVLNSLFFCTLSLRDYHYQKQQINAFYHIQAINLPFPNFEFHYLTQRDAQQDVAI
jgi:uncharacterized protein